jgi:hypothetical protein
VSSAVPSGQPAADLDAIDVATTALVDEPIALEPGAAGAAAVSATDPARSRSPRTRRRASCSWSRRASTGWQARVDGAEARVLRVNGDFMGVVVEPGSHDAAALRSAQLRGGLLGEPGRNRDRRGSGARGAGLRAVAMNGRHDGGLHPPYDVRDAR